jgi:hypothetical protein
MLKGQGVEVSMTQGTTDEQSYQAFREAVESVLPLAFKQLESQAK